MNAKTTLPPSRSRKLRYSRFVALALLAGLPTLSAEEIDWNNPAGGTWGTPSNWSLNRVPEGGDTVRLNQITTGSYTIDYNTNAGPGAWGLAIDNGEVAGYRTTLNINAAGFSTAGQVNIKRGTINLNTGGVYTPTSGEIRIFQGSTIVVNGGRLDIAGTNATYPISIGRGGDTLYPDAFATLRLDSGTIDATSTGGNLVVGSTVKGSLEVNGGKLEAANIQIGTSNAATIGSRMLITNGEVEFTQTNVSLNIAQVSGASGAIFTLSGGTITNPGKTRASNNSVITQSGGIWNNTREGTSEDKEGVSLQNGVHFTLSGGSFSVSNTTHDLELRIGNRTNPDTAATVFHKTGGNLVADNLFVYAPGVLKSASGQLWEIRGNFSNESTQAADYDMTGATLRFTGGNAHAYSVNGQDLGANAEGYVHNFGLGTLSLASLDDTLHLTLSGDLTSAALYVNALLLPGSSVEESLSLLSAVAGVTLYYNADHLDNLYLGGQNYLLSGGGELIAVTIPEPSVGALVGALVLGIGLLRKRLRRSAA